MTMMLAPDLLDRRALAHIAFRDVFGIPVRSPLAVTGAGVRVLAKKDGTIAVLEAPGFAEHSSTFMTPPASPAIGSQSIPLDIKPAELRLQARRYVLKLPRDPDPANLQGDSLFAPITITLFATPLQNREALACVLRVRVHRQSDGAFVGGALVRARSDNGQFSAVGVTDRFGEAALVFPDLPLGFAGTGGKMDAAISAKAIVKVDPASAVFTLAEEMSPAGGAFTRETGPFDPDDLAAGPAPNFAGGTPFQLSAGTEPSLELEWKQP